MIEGQDKMKDLFSSKFKNFEPEVPAFLWNEVDQRLSDQSSKYIDPLAAAATIGVATSSTTTTASIGTAAGSAASSTTAAATTNIVLIKTIAIAAGVAATVATGVVLLPEDEVIVAPASKRIEMAEAIVLPTADSIEENTIYVPFIKKAVPLVIEEKPEERKIPEIKELPKPMENPVVEVPELADIPDKPVVKPSSKGITIGLFGKYSVLSSEINERGGGLLFSNDSRSEVFKKAIADENSEYLMKHAQPISLGVSLAKQLTPDLSLETGLVYTYLSSKITSNSAYGIKENQKFHYLGIPISLNYTFYKLGETRFYVSLGGMVQKDIKGTYESRLNFSRFDINDPITGEQIYYNEPYYLKKSIKQSNLQFSALTNLGVTHPLYKNLYIYGTIGGAYYFDAGNKHRTIYSDEKLQLDFNLGLKISF